MLRTPKLRRRSLLATLESLERREVMTTVPVLMTNGGLASQPTWGQTPTPPLSDAINSIFQPESVLTTDAQGQAIDFNRDGYPDLIETGQATAMVGYGTESSSLITASRGTFGKVAFGGPNGPVFSTKGFQAVDTVTVQFLGSQAAVVDLNGDGYQDILTTVATSATPGSGFHTAQWLFDPQQQAFTRVDSATTIHGWASKTGALTLGDVTGDGTPDLVVPDFATTPVSEPQVGSVFPMIGFQVFAGVSNPSAGRWTGDFAPDAISTLTLKQPSVEWGAGALGSAPNVSVLSPFGYTSVVDSVLADLNGDGKLDLALPEADGVTTFPNPGDGKFAQASGRFAASAGGANGLNLRVGDFNNDGKPDLATSPNYVSPWLVRNTSASFSVWSASEAPLSVYLNTTPAGGPIGLTTRAVSGFESQSGWNGAMGLADFNGDGNLDIAVASGGNRATLSGIVAGDGTGQFGPLTVFTAYSNAADGYDDRFQRAIDGLAVADFNRDGQLDLVATALNIGPVGTAASIGNLANPAVGITGIAYNRTFAAPGVDPQTATALRNQPFRLQLQPTGGDPSKPYAFALNPNSVPLPAGLTLSPTGLISGTPTQTGPFQLTLNLAQPNGPRSVVRMDLNVDAAPPTAILPGALPNAVVGLPYQQQLTAARGPATWSIASGALPAGLTLSPTGLISGTPQATGTYSVQVLARGSGFEGVINYALLVQTAAATGPVVTNLARYGYHTQPTTLVVGFSQPMNAATAGALGNYILTTAGRDGRFGTRDDGTVALRSATYDVGTSSVTLAPVSRSLPLRQLYRLTIIGTSPSGLSDASGVFLAGQGGVPGTNYVRTFRGAEILAGPNPLARVLKAPARRTR